jgi:hypothetical protein
MGRGWRPQALATWLSLAALAAPASALGQTSQPFELRAYEFLERQYIFWSPQKIVVNGTGSTLGFEAQVGPHVPLYGRALDQRDPSDALHWEGRLIFTFLSNLRLTTADSAPVVTPSYRPMLRAQLLGNRVFGAPRAGYRPRSYRWGFTADLWSHHSNGQDGCTFLGAGQGCPALGGGATSLNERNGSFSTNYSGVTMDGRYSWGTRPHSRALSVIGKLGFQYHHDVPGGGLDSSPDGDIRQLWGHWHGLGELEVDWNILNQEESWAGIVYARYGLELASGSVDARLPGVRARHDTHVAEAAWICTKLYRLGLFVRVVAGRDYYNIEFTQSPTRFQFGLVIDTAGQAPSLNLRPALGEGQ